MKTLTLHPQLLPNVCFGHLPKQAEFAVNPLADHLFLDGVATRFMVVRQYGEVRLHWDGPYCYQHNPEGYAAYRRDVFSTVYQMLDLLTQAGYAPASVLGEDGRTYNEGRWLLTPPTTGLDPGLAHLADCWVAGKSSSATRRAAKAVALTGV